MTRYTPRSYQPAMTNHIVSHARCNVFAGMGVGKTPATLQAISDLLLFGLSKRVLILAPKRVAQSTWPGEVANFPETFGHLRIAVAVGTEAQRRAAIESGAEIVTTNYDNLLWLIENYGATWDFDTVIADEASRLKGARVSLQKSKLGKEFVTGQGAKRAKALARVAFTRVKRWANLTGTPAPNGLQDLWALCFFVDSGRRLGNSFTSFSHRWFRPRPGSEQRQQIIEPLPYADDQIRAAIKDITIAIEAKDHFDLPPLIENVIRIELPAGARKMYQQMEKEMFAELQTATIEAFNAGAMTQKCLAKGTQVLTRKGWVAIENIVSTDRIWDGVEWVIASGVVCNGVRAVIDCWGVKMTADHLVMTTLGWVESGKVVQSAVSDSEFDRAAVRLPDGYREGTVRTRWQQLARSLVCALRVRRGNRREGCRFANEGSGPTEVVRLSTARDVAPGVGHSRHEQAPRIHAVDGCNPEMHQHQVTRLEQLRGARHPSVRSLAGVLRGILGRYGAIISSGITTRPEGQRRSVLPRELPVGDESGTGQQSKNQCLHGNTCGTHDNRASGETLWFERGYASSTTAAQLAGGPSIPSGETAHVYDIVNCGPRNRFVVRGTGGEIFLAHNCLQIASGAAYTDDKGNWELVHDGKIDALGSVVEEAAGMPVLVFYHFKSDLARILKAFPKAVHLGADPKTIDRWNKGEIPMLVAHPQSAGHGLSLQHGSNIMCFFSSNWSLEADAQAIERAGPTRQAQSGYQRSVFVHRLVAAGTLEEVVVQRLKSKASVQDALMEAMKNSR